MADRLDVVSIRIADESTEVCRVIFRPDPGRMEHLRPERHCGVVERLHGSPVGRGEGDVRLDRARHSAG